MFEILVNGATRTYRDLEKVAVDAGRVAKGRDLSADVRVVSLKTGAWATIADPYAAVVWKDGPALAVVRQTG